LDVVRTGESSGAAVVTTRGVSVQVAASTRLRMVPAAAQPAPAAERVQLLAGRIEVDVPEDSEGRHFSVSTPDALVTVHGTSFTVEVDGRDAASTLATIVHVVRGRVVVRTATGETTLTAGSTWSSRSDSPGVATAAVAAEASGRHLAEPAASGSSSPTADRPPNPETAAHSMKRTSLPVENRLYQSAMRAKLQGRDDHVVRKLEGFLQRFPHSPLAPDARIERFRALRRLGRTEEAARGARKYLAEHPGGFAQDEARDLALEAKRHAHGEEE